MIHLLHPISWSGWMGRNWIKEEEGRAPQEGKGPGVCREVTMGQREGQSRMVSGFWVAWRSWWPRSWLNSSLCTIQPTNAGIRSTSGDKKKDGETKKWTGT